MPGRYYDSWYRTELFAGKAEDDSDDSRQTGQRRKGRQNKIRFLRGSASPPRGDHRETETCCKKPGSLPHEQIARHCGKAQHQAAADRIAAHYLLPVKKLVFDGKLINTENIVFRVYTSTGSREFVVKVVVEE